ncbi:hypothetical protein RUM44_002085 [Polyplax serrata]|uniref:Uncharacterized protein n=1 Tax=Polyplax serrata TaxID=468196 RepID=A0ABR1ANM7_POLSC
MNEKKNGKLIPPDGGWGWMVVLGVATVNLATRSLEPSFGLLFGGILQDLSVATTGAGVIYSTYEAVVNFSGIFMGPLIKSYSTRKISFLGSLMTATGLILTFPANSMAHILITYSVVVGLGVGFSSSATFVSVNNYFKEKRGQAVGIAMTGTALGFLLMPQAIRYLTEEYDFAGSILIVGAFALNGCVGSALLQPVKWHWKQIQETETSTNVTNDQNCDLNRQNSEVKLQSRHPTCPHSMLEETIEEEHDNEEASENAMGQQENSILSLESYGFPNRRVSDFRPKFYLPKPYRKFSLNEKDQPNEDSFLVDQYYVSKPLNKSSTEVKFDRYFEGVGGGKFFHKRKYATSSASLHYRHQEMQLAATPAQTMRQRKSSIISNMSSLDFTGSYLYLHAVDDLGDECNNLGNQNETKEATNKTEGTVWQKISAFMDLELLKDPVYLNILFGISIFNVAESNFKMIVPFYLADLGQSKSETAFCLSMMAASDIAARLIVPPICDRAKISRRLLFMVSSVFCALMRSVLAESDVWIQFETILILNGFFRGATIINYHLVIPEYCDNKLNKLPAALGIHMVCKGIFLVSLGPLVGMVRDITSSFPLCIHVQNLLIGICVLAWVIEYLLVRGKKSTIDEMNETKNNQTA